MQQYITETPLVVETITSQFQKSEFGLNSVKNFLIYSLLPEVVSEVPIYRSLYLNLNKALNMLKVLYKTLQPRENTLSF